LFALPHLGGAQFSDEEIDELHDSMIANEGHTFREVMRGQPGPAPSKWSVLPSASTRSMPWDWKSPEQQADEIMGFALGLDTVRED
jgi:hypothetical protein